MCIGDPNPEMSASLAESMSDYVAKSVQISIFMFYTDARIKQNDIHSGGAMCHLDSP